MVLAPQKERHRFSRFLLLVRFCRRDRVAPAFVYVFAILRDVCRV